MSRRPHLIASLLLACASLTIVAREPVIGGPCDGCELVFEGMPERDALDADARIAPADAEGEPMILEGTVRTAGGEPAEGVIVYAYQTDDGGIYPRAQTRHGALRGWARTDAEGRYRFGTIRPGGYPGTRIPQHVHMHVIEPGRATYWIDDVNFTDDPHLRGGDEGADDARGGSGTVTPTRDAQGRWQATRDIVLGRNVPGYDGLAARDG